MKFFDELKRRNVIKSTIAYIVVAWVLLQVISTVLPSFEAPSWVFKSLTFVIAIGFPLWIIFSWVYEVTPEGLKKTAKVSEENSITEVTNKRLNIIIIIMLIVAIGVSFVNEPISKLTSKNIVNTDLIVDKSIAVLPFVNMSGDIEQEYFADGLSEELINVFTKLPELRVIGRTSSFAFKGKNEDLRKIGKSLGVEYLLEGSVRKSENKIRITAQLIKSKDGSHLWSETFDRNLDDIFEIQDEISSSVADALSLRLSNNNSLLKNKIISTEAYNYFLRGKYYYETNLNADSTNEALKWFKEAINSDPSFSLAWTYLSMCYWRKTVSTKQDTFIEAKKAALKALELDPTSGIAAVNVAEILDNEYDFHGALEKINLALNLDPKNPYVLRNVGRFYTILGRKHEGITYCKSALKNDPIQRTALLYLIEAFYYSEEYDSVNRVINNYKDRFPNTLQLRIWADVLATKNNLTQAVEEAKRRDLKLLELYVNVLHNGRSGKSRKSQELLENMVSNYPSRPYFIALTYASIGEYVKTMDWLEKAYAYKDKDLVYVNVEPKFKTIRNNSRFKGLIRKMNYPK